MASSEYPQRLVRRLRGCGGPRANAGRRRFDWLCMPCWADHTLAFAKGHGYHPGDRHGSHPLQPWAQHEAGGGREPIDAGAHVSNVIENWNGANSFILYGKGGEIATNDLQNQELTIYAGAPPA